LFILHFALSSAGCSWFRPADEGPLQSATADEIMQQLRAKAGEVQTLKGLFRAQIQGAGIPIPQRIEGAVFFERPDRYRVRGFSRIGSELFDLIMARNLYRLRIGTNGQLYSGRADELPRIGPVSEPFRLTMFALSGITGMSAVEDGTRVALQEDADRYRLDVFDQEAAPGPGRRLWFDRRSLQLVQEDRLAPDGGVLATARFEDVRRVTGPMPAAAEAVSDPNGSGGILRPYRIVVQDARGGGMVVLTFHELTVNMPLAPGELRPEPRPAAIPAEPAS
jgi:hypothetical protein